MACQAEINLVSCIIARFLRRTAEICARKRFAACVIAARRAEINLVSRIIAGSSRRTAEIRARKRFAACVIAACRAEFNLVSCIIAGISRRTAEIRAGKRFAACVIAACRAEINLVSRIIAGISRRTAEICARKRRKLAARRFVRFALTAAQLAAQFFLKPALKPRAVLGSLFPREILGFRKRLKPRSAAVIRAPRLAAANDMRNLLTLVLTPENGRRCEKSVLRRFFHGFGNFRFGLRRKLAARNSLRHKRLNNALPRRPFLVLRHLDNRS